MFDLISNSFNKIISKIKGKAFITEADFNTTLSEITLALLEADVPLQVVRYYTSKLKEKIVGEKVINTLTAGQLIIKAVQDELTNILGSEQLGLKLDKSHKPNIILLTGLQGSGKTTTSAKLALYLKKQKYKVLLVSLDTYRPAAQKQLEILAKQIAIDVLPIVTAENPLQIAKRALLNQEDFDVIILDTAGRLHIDGPLIEELKQIKQLTNPVEILLVIDAMTGQDAINIAKNFNDSLILTGVIMTRLDGDSRGGAALSCRYVTNCPIKFLGLGEKLNDLEVFHPDRIANRILGMGDITSLVEKVSEELENKQIEDLKAKVEKGNFDFNDMALQLKTLSKLGGLTNVIKYIPGLNKMKLPGMLDETVTIKNLAIINSMTSKERKDYKLINGSRKKRIAKGSGVTPQDVNNLLKRFQQALGLISQLNKKGGLNNLDPQALMQVFKK